MEFENFETINFPQDPNIIYIIGIDYGKEFIPFYIGETSRNVGRFGDYISAKFSASTDFKVGEAIKYFIKNGYKIKIKFKKSKDRKKEEKELLSKLGKKFILLNDLKGYDYRYADKIKEAKKIYKFVKDLLKNLNQKID